MSILISTGDNWAERLSNCRATLGTESGASIWDRDGSIEQFVDEALGENPEADFHDIFENVLKPHDGKLIFRKTMERHLPELIAKAQKKGFSAPDSSWFKGESIELVKRRLISGESKIFEILDKESIGKLVNEHLEGNKNRRLLIWSLLKFTLSIIIY